MDNWESCVVFINFNNSVESIYPTMKYFVLEKTKYILNNSWIGYLIPAGVHQLLNGTEKSSTSGDKPSSFKAHPAETRISRTIASKARP